MPSDVANNVKVVWDTAALERLASDQVLRLLTQIGTKYTNNVKLAMRNSPRGGKNVNKRGQRRSGPGEPPAPEFSDLIKSVRFQVRQIGGRWVMEAGSTLRKAAYLEFGAARGRVMQARDISGKFTKAKTMSWVLYPRPVWGPELLKMRKEIPGLVAKLPKARR